MPVQQRVPHAAGVRQMVLAGRWRHGRQQLGEAASARGSRRRAAAPVGAGVPVPTAAPGRVHQQVAEIGEWQGRKASAAPWASRSWRYTNMVAKGRLIRMLTPMSRVTTRAARASEGASLPLRRPFTHRRAATPRQRSGVCPPQSSPSCHPATFHAFGGHRQPMSSGFASTPKPRADALLPGW